MGDKWDGGTVVGGYDWFGYDFNDDVMWLIIAATRAYLLTGQQSYLNDARRNFDLIWNRAHLGYVDLLRWAEQTGSRNGTNSCINGPAEVAACYIGMGSGDEAYFEKARLLYQNQRQYLYEPGTGKVYDSVELNPDDGSIVSRNTWASTYNQGTMLGAAVLLHRHYGEAQYKADAEKIIAYARSALCNGHGVVRVCQNADGDFQGFKGILMRYAGLFAREYDSAEYQSWLLANAFHAYNNMNSRGFGHSAWLTKAAENLRFGDVNYGASSSAFGGATALSAACSVPIDDRIGRPDVMEAEKALRSGNAQVETDEESGGQYVGSLDNGAQVRFTYECAAAGEYLLKIYYLTAQSRNLQVAVGSSRQTVTCPSVGTWSRIADEGCVFVHVNLAAGRNIIALNNPNGGCPNIDKIAICPFMESRREQAVMTADQAQADGDYTTFGYTAMADGHYLVGVDYQSDERSSMFLQVNDGIKAYTTYAPTNGHTGRRQLFVALRGGANTLTFGNDAGAVPAVSRVSVSRLGDTDDSLEAERASYTGQVRVGNDAKASGGQYVSGVGNGSDNVLTFRYDAPETTDYELLVSYYTAQNRQMYHRVNNGTKTTVGYAAVDGWAVQPAGTVSLKAGTNTITLGSDSGLAPYIDKVVLSRKGVPTAVVYQQAVRQASAGDAWYTPAGVRIASPKAPGVYVRQGRRYVVR